LIQQTSLLAYESIRSELGARQRVVYLAIKTHPNLTDQEYSLLLNLPINEVTPRRYELYNLGLIKGTGRKKNKSGRLALTWAVR